MRTVVRQCRRFRDRLSRLLRRWWLCCVLAWRGRHRDAKFDDQIDGIGELIGLFALVAGQIVAPVISEYQQGVRWTMVTLYLLLAVLTWLIMHGISVAHTVRPLRHKYDPHTRQLATALKRIGGTALVAAVVLNAAGRLPGQQPPPARTLPIVGADAVTFKSDGSRGFILYFELDRRLWGEPLPELAVVQVIFRNDFQYRWRAFEPLGWDITDGNEREMQPPPAMFAKRDPDAPTAVIWVPGLQREHRYRIGVRFRARFGRPSEEDVKRAITAARHGGAVQFIRAPGT